MTTPVLFRTFPTACGRHWAVATLNAPAALNALSLPMVQLLHARLQSWALDETVMGVTLDASGDRAFCAGGDLRALYPSLQDDGGSLELPKAFFAEEYSLDHTIHHYKKPLLCWGHGIVMGGGVGLFVGASHRVVTPQSRLAMPEISIGLFPDVGGSWFLRRMPGRSGLFAGLTGAIMNAADARYAGLADHLVAQADKEAVHARIAGLEWLDESGARRTQLSKILAIHEHSDAGQAPLKEHAAAIESLMAGDSLEAISARLNSAQPDAWLEKACENFRRGSPTSAALTFELWKKSARLGTLADVFRLEFNVALACCTHHDLKEGIRAVLVDKDRKPRWSPPDLKTATGERLARFFLPQNSGPHPLAFLHNPAPNPNKSP